MSQDGRHVDVILNRTSIPETPPQNRMQVMTNWRSFNISKPSPSDSWNYPQIPHVIGVLRFLIGMRSTPTFHPTPPIPSLRHVQIPPQVPKGAMSPRMALRQSTDVPFQKDDRVIKELKGGGAGFPFNMGFSIPALLDLLKDPNAIDDRKMLVSIIPSRLQDETRKLTREFFASAGAHSRPSLGFPQWKDPAEAGARDRRAS